MASSETPNGHAATNGHPAVNGHANVTEHAERAPFEVAIVGGGIVGLCMARGLLTRNIPVTVYEQSAEIREVGVGIGFSDTIIECMVALDPQIVEKLAKISIRGQGIRWVDGTCQEDNRLRSEDQLADVEMLDDQFRAQGCHRAHFVSAVVSLLPEGCLKLGKRLVKLEEKETGKVSLKFGDGETVEADALIGCDGVKSYVRRAVVGEDDPSAVAHFAGEAAWRCLLDMKKVAPVLGEYARKMYWWLGPGANLVTYPVANYKFVNVAAFIQEKEWSGGDGHTAQGSKQEVIEAFSKWGPLIRGLVDVFPEELNRWAMFDTLDHPLRSFAFGLVALAGDAAHAMTPHNGQGAGMGIEDGLVLATLLDQGAKVLRGESNGGGVDVTEKSKVVREAFKAYDAGRRERAQWVVWSSRRQGVLSKWEDAEIGSDGEWIARDTRERYDRIFTHDWRGMVDGAKDDFEKRLRRTA